MNPKNVVLIAMTLALAAEVSPDPTGPPKSKVVITSVTVESIQMQQEVELHQLEGEATAEFRIVFSRTRPANGGGEGFGKFLPGQTATPIGAAMDDLERQLRAEILEQYREVTGNPQAGAPEVTVLYNEPKLDHRVQLREGGFQSGLSVHTEAPERNKRVYAMIYSKVTPRTQGDVLGKVQKKMAITFTPTWDEENRIRLGPSVVPDIEGDPPADFKGKTEDWNAAEAELLRTLREQASAVRSLLSRMYVSVPESAVELFRNNQTWSKTRRYPFWGTPRTIKVTVAGESKPVTSDAEARTSYTQAKETVGLWEFSMNHPRLGQVSGQACTWLNWWAGPEINGFGIDATLTTGQGNVTVSGSELIMRDQSEPWRAINALLFNDKPWKVSGDFGDFSLRMNKDKTQIEGSWDKLPAKWRKEKEEERPIETVWHRKQLQIENVTVSPVHDYQKALDIWKFYKGNHGAPQAKIRLEGNGLPPAEWIGKMAQSTTWSEPHFFQHKVKATDNSIEISGFLRAGFMPGRKTLLLAGTPIDVYFQFTNYKRPTPQMRLYFVSADAPSKRIHNAHLGENVVLVAEYMRRGSDRGSETPLFNDTFKQASIYIVGENGNRTYAFPASQSRLTATNTRRDIFVSEPFRIRPTPPNANPGINNLDKLYAEMEFQIVNVDIRVPDSE